MFFLLLLMACGLFSSPPTPPPEVVVFVVIDTLRADHTSLCGYGRPTTPALATLAARGQHTCDLVSAAPWTHPSHATLFTGLPVTEHGAQWSGDSPVAVNDFVHVRPLHSRFTTLAESFSEAGFQTVAVSANGIVNDASGLLQGFDRTVVARGMQDLRRAKLGAAVETELAALDPSRPVFLFVNIFDAHDPYPAVTPELSRLGFGEPQPRTVLQAYTASDANPYYRFLKGRMAPTEAQDYLRTLTNGYDAGILHADRNLADVLQRLRSMGWLSGAHRVVITSDHGELLGEHGLLRHGGFLWEPGIRVPLVAFGSAELPALPAPMAATDVFGLVRHGRMPDAPTLPTSVSERDPGNLLVGTEAGALRDGPAKLMCVDGQTMRFDLNTDPGETQPLPIGDHPQAAALASLCAAVAALKALPVPQDPSGEVNRALRELGYLDPEPAPREPEGPR